MQLSDTKWANNTHRKCHQMPASDWTDWDQMMSPMHQRPSAAGTVDTERRHPALELETHRSAQARAHMPQLNDIFSR